MWVISPLLLLSTGLAACSDDEGSPTGAEPAVFELPATYEDGIRFDIAEGKNVRITATGEVNTNPGGPVADCDIWTDADGIPDCSYVISEPLCHGLPFMALIGIFNGDEYFLVGADFDSTFSEAGEFWLEINDWDFADNAGAFTISVHIR